MFAKLKTYDLFGVRKDAGFRSVGDPSPPLVCIGDIYMIKYTRPFLSVLCIL